MNRRGFMFLDVLIALMIVGAAAGMLVVAGSRIDRAVRTLDDTRAAQRLATETLIAMQHGTAAPGSDGRIAIEEIKEAPAPIGWRWVTINCQLGRGKAALTGLVRSDP
ncbi:MAG: hypothetical protein H7144_03505 [Burkholderiales bacterium]|nr:hypothetical protein [Phycisphaerae bacterium]